MDNMIYIVEKMLPEDDDKRAEVVTVFDSMLGDFEKSTLGKDGEYSNRIGNEIMIDMKDIM